MGFPTSAYLSVMQHKESRETAYPLRYQQFIQSSIDKVEIRRIPIEEDPIIMPEHLERLR
jgi:hypothetical protein